MILAAELVLIVVAIPIALACGYLALLTALSGRPDATPTCTAYPKIDIVVPAHDESLGIAGTLASLSAVDYPRSRYRIFVVADNCTDDTAQRATAAGACVILRTVPEARGKGHALAFAFDGLLPRAHVLSLRRRRPICSLQRRAMSSAQKPGHGFEGFNIGQMEGVPPPIVKPTVRDRGDG